MLGFMLLDPYALSTNSIAMPFYITLRQQNISIDVAIFGETRSQTHTYSWVNGARTPEHGSHIDGLFAALKKVSWKPVLSLIHVVMFDPRFAGSSRSARSLPHIQDMR